MYYYSRKKSIVVRRISLARLILLIGVAAVTAFIAVSLWSYNPFDRSLLYISFPATPVTNWCGAVGAHAAALLLYFFGCSSFLVPLGLLLYVVMESQGIGVDLREKVASFFFFICSLSAVCSLHRYAFSYELVPGGLCGHQLTKLFYTYCNIVGTALCVYTMMTIALVLVARSWCVYLVQAIVQGLVFVYQRSFFIPHAGRALYSLLMRCVSMIRTMGSWLWSIISGSMVHNEHATIAEFEFGTDALSPLNQVSDPAFWEHAVEQARLAHTTAPKVVMSKSIAAHKQELEPLSSVINKPIIVVDQEEAIEQSMSVVDVVDKEQSIDCTEPETVEQGALPYQLPKRAIFVGVQQEGDDASLVMQLEQRARTLEEKLQRFGVKGSVVSIKRGPVVTLFEYRPDINSKISKIVALEDDLALALQALSIRIIAPIPGRPVVGFEVANAQRKSVVFANIALSPSFTDHSGGLPLILGEDTIGNHVVADLTRMPHLLVAGSTGSGKSVALNGMLVSLLCSLRPDELRLILIDPKRLEFAPYADIAHLLVPIVTDPKKASPVLRWVVQEMERRYETMAKWGVRNSSDYNEQIAQTGKDERMPYIVVVIDELSDLMMTAGKDIEDCIARITQMARAAGIHMIVATQRPSVDVITGLIKVNFPSRIAFRVTSKIDSRTILDCGGADKLLGKGDMLFLDSAGAGLSRVHGAYVSDREINDLVSYIRQQQKPDYLDIQSELINEDYDKEFECDSLYEEVLEYLKGVEDVSISLLQRKFKIGYNRSARIIDSLEAQGHVLPSEGGKARKVVHSR